MVDLVGKPGGDSMSRLTLVPRVLLAATHLTAVSVLALAVGGPVQAVTLDWVTVGDPGNADDNTGHGGVGYEYQIGKYEVTAGQYTEFLNAIAATDAYGLYAPAMWSSSYGCKIQRYGSSGNYTYSVASSYEDKPVNYVTLWDALRFANWLHNGQPAGAQDITTTEDGAYTLNGYTGHEGHWISRNTGARVFLPLEDEWYKAAYYRGGGTNAGYWEYSTQSNTVPTAEAPPGMDVVNGSANYNMAVGNLTEVGAYTTKPSQSAYGTFDQDGNLWEYNETFIPSSWGLPYYRGIRGGSFLRNQNFLPASRRMYTVSDHETYEYGFRVARLPEPALVVGIDIKPGSCPNSWNRDSNGVLPVAILGTEDLDVTEIDVSSVTISRADGTGGSVGPNEGPPGPHSVFEDVGTPFEGEECGCHEAEGDGILDLSMKFRTQDVANLLPVDDSAGALVPLVVSGTLLDGTPFTSSSDCVRLVPPGTPPGQVSVQSAEGSWVDATPLDNNLDGGGFGSFQRTYPHTTWLTLTAPSGHNGNPFVGWKLDGGEIVQGRSITFVVNNAEHTARAVFKKANSCGLGVELALLVPPLMWLYGRRRRRTL